jgi:membrane protease subunit HflC
VRIKKIDLPARVSDSVYRRMRAERERVARDYRSKGAEAAERIRADADRQRSVILAEAYRDSEIVRGEGDARATDIYAKAFNNDEEFYRFYRSLNAYKNNFSTSDDVILLEPDSEFFRYFKDSSGKK